MMVYDNCRITHKLEDCIVTSLTNSNHTNLIDIMLVSNEESPVGEPIRLTNDDENADLLVILEVAHSDLWSELGSTEETASYQTFSKEPSMASHAIYM